MDYWNDFVRDVYNLLSDYRFQKDRQNYNVRNLNNWGKTDKDPGIRIVNENIAQFLSLLRTYNVNVDKVNTTENYDYKKLMKLDKVLQITLRATPTITYKEEEGKVIIQGTFVKLSDVNLAYIKLKKNEVKIIELYATDTVFIDVDYTSTNSNSLIIMAPKWSVIGARTIELKGNDGPSLEQRRAENSSETGGRGQDGQPGLPGDQGGNFFGIGEVFINGNNLTVVSRGGKGGRGQDGGDGGAGRDGVTPVSSMYDNFPHEKIGGTRWRIYGEIGRKGGAGGDGGKGGMGGNPGQVKIFALGSHPGIEIRALRGDEGEGGKGGIGGPGGKNGKIVEATFIICCWSGEEQIENTLQTPKGDDGLDNANVSGRISPREETESCETYIEEFKLYLRENVKQNPMIEKRIKLFLLKLDTDPEITDYLSVESIMAGYAKLQYQFNKSNNPIDFFPYYENLLYTIERKIQNIGTDNEDGKILLCHLYSAALTKLNLLKDDYLSSGIIVNIPGYFNIILQNLKSIKKDERSIFWRYRNVDNGGIEDFIEDTEKFIKKFGIEALENKSGNPTINILKMTNKILDMLVKMNRNILDIQAENKQMPKFLLLGKSSEIKKPDSQITNIKLFSSTIENIDFNATQGDIKKYGESIRNIAVGLAKQVNTDIKRFEKELDVTKRLDVSKWKIPQVLKQIKYYIKRLNREDSSNTLEGINFVINIYRKLEDYYYQKKMTDHIINIVSEDWSSRMKNATLSNTINKLKQDMKLNLVLAHYEHAVNIVRQYTFPYFDEISKEYKLQTYLLRKTNVSELAEMCINEINSLNRTLFRSINPIDQYTMTDSRLDNHFFTWKQTKYGNLFSKFIAGEELLLKADINRSKYNGVRFNFIDLRFKASNKSEQKKIDDYLKFFNIWLTHTGNSYYKCDKKTYVITTSSSPMSYKYDVNRTLNINLNQVAYKLYNNDYLLSPYTTWKLSLGSAVSASYNTPFTLNINGKVDLKLVGRMKFIEEDPHVCNRNIDDFYEVEDPLELHETTDNRRYRRNVEDYVKSAASSFSSPINNIFHWLTSSLSSSVGRITYLGQLAYKPVESFAEESVNSMEFFDQVNSVLILAPVLLWLGKSWFMNLPPLEFKTERVKKSDRNAWRCFLNKFERVLLKYKLDPKWLWDFLEDVKLEIDSTSNLVCLENRLINVLIDFLDDVQYDPVYSYVKCDECFVNDLNGLIEFVSANVPNFGSKRSLQLTKQVDCIFLSNLSIYAKVHIMDHSLAISDKVMLRTKESETELNAVKKWMKNQSHLPETMEDAKIRNFFITNKYNVRKTQQKIDMYYTIRSLIPDFYEDSNPNSDNYKHLMDTTYFFVFPNTTKDDHKISIIKAKESDQIMPREMVMQFCNIIEIRLSEEVIVGEILIFDMINVSVNALKKLTPSFLAKAIAIFEKVYSLRIKEIYLINSRSHINLLVAILKLLLKEKIFERVKVQRNDDVMKELLAKSLLPKDYGGDGPALQDLNEITKLKLTQYQERFDQLDKLRINKSSNMNNLEHIEVLTD